MVAMWLRREWRVAADRDLAEPSDRAWLDRQHQAGGAGFVIDLDLLLADLGECEPFFTEGDLEVGSGPDDVLGNDRIAGPNREGFAQVGGLLAGGVEAGEFDRLERVLAARFGGEDDLQSAGGRLDLGFDGRIEIAAGAQQLGEQLGIRAGAAVDLRRVDGLAAPFAERRLSVEGLHQRWLIVDRLQPFEQERIFAQLGGVDRLRLQLGRRIRRRRRVHRVHVRPLDAKIGQWLEWRAGIELRCAGRLGKDRKGRESRAPQPRTKGARPALALPLTLIDLSLTGAPERRQSGKRISGPSRALLRRTVSRLPARSAASGKSESHCLRRGCARHALRLPARRHRRSDP